MSRVLSLRRYSIFSCSVDNVYNSRKHVQRGQNSILCRLSRCVWHDVKFVKIGASSLGAEWANDHAAQSVGVADIALKWMQLDLVRCTAAATSLGLWPSGLPWGLNFNPHTHPIPTEKPMGIPTESPYPQNPEILHTHIHPVYFCLMHISFYFCHVCHLYVV